MFGFATQSWRRAGVEGIWVFVGQFFGAVGGIIGIRILTELTPQDIWGQANLLLGLLIIGRNIFVGPFQNAQFRFHAEYAAIGKRQWFTREIRRLEWRATALFAGVAAVGFAIWKLASASMLSWLLLLPVVVLIAAETQRVILTTPLHAERRRVIPSLWASLEQWALVLASAAALMLQVSVESYMIGRTLGTIFCLVLFGYLLYPRLSCDTDQHPPQPRRQFLGKMLSFGMPFVPVAVTTWVLNVGDRYVMGAYMGDEAVGMYSAAYALASQPFIQAAGVLLGFAKPILYQAAASGDAHKMRKVLTLWLTLNSSMVVIGVLLFVLFGNVVARFLLAEGYRAAAPPIFVWVGLGYGFFLTSAILEVLAMALGQSARLVMPSAVSAVFNVVANIIVIPRWGLTGAAQVTAATFALQLLLLTGSLLRVRSKAMQGQQ